MLIMLTLQLQVLVAAAKLLLVVQLVLRYNHYAVTRFIGR